MSTLIDVLPLRAILFQLLFVVMSIAIDSMMLERYLSIGRKTSIQYSATANLLSTVTGWFIFFLVTPMLSPDWEQQLIQYIFFDVPSNLALWLGLAFIVFIGTFLLKLQTMDWLDWILGIKKPTSTEIVQDPSRFRGRKGQLQSGRRSMGNRALAMLWANAASFSAVTLIIAIRTFFQEPTL